MLKLIQTTGFVVMISFGMAMTVMAAPDFQETLRAAERGNAIDQFNLGIMYYTGDGVQQNKSEAMKWCMKAAKQGYAKAQFNLGFLYHNGEGVRQDRHEALKWYMKAAKQGHAEAQFNLGLMYIKGEGIRQNKKEAKEWFGKACDNGLEGGCKNYRILNEKGI